MKKSITNQQGKTVYNLKFFGIKDLYDYLKSNPEVNTRIFSEQASLREDRNFSGEPLDVSIEYLLNGYVKDFENFLQANKKLQNGLTEYIETYKMERSMFVGAPIAPLVAANVPKCRFAMKPVHELEVRNIYYNLSYPHKTQTDQIRNRGLITLFIIQALEARGVMVNFKAFELSKCGNEIFHLSLDLKKQGEEVLNIQKCYFIMVAKEFLRRILFRVLESSDVTDLEWGDGYGESFNKLECKEFLNAKDHDIIITRPRELNIMGEDLYEDTLNMIKALNLEDDFDVKKIRKLCGR